MLAALTGALATYASFLLILGASALVGQAIFIACGRRRWTRLAPAVGLAALGPLAWWAVRMPSEGTAAIVALGIVTIVSGAAVFALVEGLGGALRRGIPLEFCAVVIASLPFIVEGRFGILGTSLNPDMSQHLFAVDRLASGMGERLSDGGYPLGPHSIVVAVSELGPNTVHAFGGLMLATAVAACLVGLGLLERLSPWRRIAGALVIGFAYLVASYLTQGAFKETIAALFLLAFAVGIDQVAGEWRSDRDRPHRWRAVPLAVLVAGAAYAYSFPGVVWLGAALVAWIGLELIRAAVDGRLAGAAAIAREAAVPALIATGVAVAAIAPELGRMADFANFETFNPAGAGLGNLFNRLSPLEALGIWPSGDFRIEPGDGAVPAFVFDAGALVGAAALAYGLAWFWRQRRLALPGAVAAATALWLYSLIDGTPYQEAKALLLLAPLVLAISVCGLLWSRLPALVGIAFLAAAGGSAVLALANGPVGPTGYSPQLAELRENLPDGSIIVLAPDEVLADEHGVDYLSWELRGHRLCIEPESAGGAAGTLPSGAAATVKIVVVDGALVPESIDTNDSAPPEGPCPLVSDSARADPGSESSK
jgi:hypothetical protein